MSIRRVFVVTLAGWALVVATLLFVYQAWARAQGDHVVIIAVGVGDWHVPDNAWISGAIWVMLIVIPPLLLTIAFAMARKAWSMLSRRLV